MASSLQYIDHTHQGMILEVAAVGRFYNGAYSYSDCASMPFDLYRYLMEKVPHEIARLVKEAENAGT